MTKMLEAALLTGEIPLLEDVLTWAKDRLPHDGVTPEHVYHRFQIYREVIVDLLPDEFASEVIPYLDWMMTRQRELNNLG